MSDLNDTSDASRNGKIVSCQNVSKSFVANSKSVSALTDVSIDLHAGELVAIRGKSGCGKSTLMLTIGGLQKPDTGTVEIDGRSLYGLNAEDRAKFRGEHIGYVFQQFHLIPYLTVLENVLAARLGITKKSRTAGKPDGLAVGKELVDRVGLSHRIDHNPDQLSIGECQRVAIARALMNQPKVVLADEPTGNLDGENTETVLQSLRQIANDGTAVAIVTHDPQCDTVADRVVMMDDHRIV